MSKKYPNLIKAGLKVGDTVDSIWGDMTVISIASDPIYPIRAGNKNYECSFNKYGYSNIRNVYPSIWFKSDTDWFKPPMSPPEPDHVKEFYTDRPVWVRDDGDEDWEARYAAVYLPSNNLRFRVFSGGRKQELAVSTYPFKFVSYTKPEGAEDHENADMPAMPLQNDANGNPYVVTGHMNPLKAISMTKREKFAMAAMQGLVSASTQDGTWSHDAETAASTAVEYADALLKALERSK